MGPSKDPPPPPRTLEEERQWRRWQSESSPASRLVEPDRASYRNDFVKWSSLWLASVLGTAFMIWADSSGAYTGGALALFGWPVPLYFLVKWLRSRR
jgi:hypothetical protein